MFATRKSGSFDLQDQALLALPTLASQQGGAGGRFEDFTNTLVGFGRAFEVFVGTDLLTHFLALERPTSVLVAVCLGESKKRTCSGVTGFWEVFASSSMVFGSCRRSHLHPTRMMGRPWQKWRTSEIH